MSKNIPLTIPNICIKCKRNIFPLQQQEGYESLGMLLQVRRNNRLEKSCQGGQEMSMKQNTRVKKIPRWKKTWQFRENDENALETVRIQLDTWMEIMVLVEMQCVLPVHYNITWVEK